LITNAWRPVIYPLRVHFFAEPRIRGLPVIIRKYCKADMDEIIDIWFQGWHAIDSKLVHPQSKAEWRERWISRIVPQHEIAVAESDKEILGFITLNPESSELSQIFTRLSQQGPGLAARCSTGQKTGAARGSTCLRWKSTIVPGNSTKNTVSERPGHQPIRSAACPRLDMNGEAADRRSPSEAAAIVYHRKLIRFWHSDRQQSSLLINGKIKRDRLAFHD